MKRSILYAASALVLFGSAFLAHPSKGLAAASSVTVNPGDTLWTIAQQNQITLQALEAANPSVNPGNLTIGSTLELPSSAQSSTGTYQVKSGDTLWSIANQWHVSVAALQAANPHVQPQDLQPGVSLTIPGGTASNSASAGSINQQDLYWMAHLIHAEAQGESLQAQIAVGDVVWHRMQDPQYPDTAQGVVFQQINGHYQFTCVPEGTIYETPDANAYQAAQDVLAQHEDVVPGAYVFYNPAKTPAGSWVWSQRTIATIDQLVFAQ